MIHRTTQQIIDDLAQDRSLWITSALYSHRYSRRYVSAAFRIAKASGIIEQIALSVVGTPIYRRPLRLCRTNPLQMEATL